ncbi:beta-galactosidase [Pedobacter nyackensis]|uniref:beta-galactosidase n=1 Tax=Pedobacter nyackensis TaxID=475255 RepID=UPI00292F8A78|nr:beta-galactosidase [Pedobacter nyackensis]
MNMFKLKTQLVVFCMCFAYLANAQVYEIDARAKTARKENALPFSGKNPAGITLSANNKYFEKNGKPWFPVMGELHYNRVPYQEWEQEIIKMKSGGLSIVATYVFWNEHETAKGVWDWKNNRDIRRFVELCARHHMLVWLRIGPWSHGEQLNGGYPDWIQKMKGHRSNDPEYLAESAKLYRQIGLQTKSLYFKDGGPIIGTQLENEYASGQPGHIAKLKEMALQANITPVYWSITANTVFDDKKMEVIPLQGAYAYRGWERAGGKATKDFLYGNDQWIMSDALGKVYYDVTMFPKGMCEQGAGSQMTFNNRFVVDPGVAEAHVQNQVGRGMNLMGYYMFHGGTQTPGLEEPGYPYSYDFQAPLDEFGLLRPSYKYLKVLHTFINDFGTDLAEMQVFEAENPVRNELDTAKLRYVVRANNNSGFLFLGNTQVRVNMPDKNVSVKVKLDQETITFPYLLLKGQTIATLPFNLKVGKAVIKYVTAQPLARLVNGKKTTIFFQELPGVNPQLAFDDASIVTKNFEGWKVEKSGNNVQLTAGKNKNLEVKDKEGNIISLVFLSRKQAENSWRLKLKGEEALVVSEADVMIEDNKLTLQQTGNDAFGIQVYPRSLNAISGLKSQSGKTAVFDSYIVKTTPYVPKVTITYPEKQNAVVQLPKNLPSNVASVILKVDYLGGSALLLQNGKHITDNLYNGETWNIGLQRFMKGGEITLKLQDWNNRTTGVAPELVKEITEKGTMFKKVNAVPQYQTVLNLSK